jgi:hypothetical protein
LPLLLPPRQQRPLELLQHHSLMRPACEDSLDNIGCQQGEPKDPADVALRDILGVPYLTDRGAHTPSSSIRCHRHARARASTNVPSGRGFEVCTISLPSGETIRLRMRAGPPQIR